MDVRSQLLVLDLETAQDRFAPSHDPDCVTVSVAHNMEDMMKAVAVRAAVYMSEQNCPYAEEFDGNDFSATHILCLVGEEPAATMRIRYFAGFAKPERIAVRPEFRKSGVAAKMITYGMDLCRQKGYMRLYGHAQKRLVPFWERLGWRALGTPEFVFSDHRYVEMECLPPGLKGQRYYYPTDHGVEKRIAERLEEWLKRRNK